MAMGTSAHQGIGAVKSTCNSLEVSPSHKSATSPIYHGGSRATGHGVKEHTKKLKHGTTRPKPRGTHVEGKKSITAGKSHGR